ncbi:MAG: hypothetical protein ACLP50_27880 [Solirubrobacteraceae bacterium]
MRLHFLRLRRPSPAIVISSLALFMAVGGAAYAQTQIPNGSVGTPQLANGAVTNSKLRDNAVNYYNIVGGAVGIRRINTGQVQVRVSGTCASGSAIGTINTLGQVTCNSALPSEVETTNNTAAVPTTATAPVSVTSVALPTGASYLALANPTATVTSTATAQHVTVSCTLTVGSNTETRNMTLDTTGTAAEVSSASIPLQASGPSGTATVACQSSVAGTATPPTISVTAALNAIQITSAG